MPDQQDALTLDDQPGGANAMDHGGSLRAQGMRV
jgi:hypothetical protein